ncbi:MAG: DUF2971 domain-containing protein [Bacteroidota bacterium]
MSLPQILYKFRHFDDANHVRMLTHREIFFPSPIKFNDPFDAAIPVRYEDGTPEQIIQWFDNYLAEVEPALRPPERIKKARQMFKNAIHRNHNWVQLTRTRVRALVETIGIFSTSAANENILNWSHYSAGHKGFCVGFYSQQLLNICTFFTFNQQRPASICGVNYSPDYPRINPFAMSNRDRLNAQFLTKAKDWIHEKEYRLLLAAGANEVLPLDESSFASITLGCSIDQEHKNLVVDILNTWKIKPILLQSHRDDDAFSLHFEPISY